MLSSVSLGNRLSHCHSNGWELGINFNMNDISSRIPLMKEYEEESECGCFEIWESEISKGCFCSILLAFHGGHILYH